MEIMCIPFFGFFLFFFLFTAGWEMKRIVFPGVFVFF